MYIGLLKRNFDSIADLEKFFNWCRVEYVEQKTNFTDLTIEDALSTYSCLEIKEKVNGNC